MSDDEGSFNLETATVTQIINEIVGISLTDYGDMGKEMAEASPELTQAKVVELVLQKYVENETMLDVYFKKLKILMKNAPVGRQELERKQFEIELLIRRNGLSVD